MESETFPETVVERLRRIEGQVRGLQRMVREGRSPSEIIYQMAAVKSALEQAALHYLQWEAQQHTTQEEPASSVKQSLKLIAKML